MRKSLPWLLLPLAIFGLWLAFDLTATHFQLVHRPEVKLDSWCDVNQTFSCSQVNSSRYSSFPVGEGKDLPIAIPAIGFFLATGLLGLLSTRRTDEEGREGDLAVVVLLGAAGVAFGLYLVAVQAFILHAWCLKCLLMDAATIGTFAVAWAAHGGSAAGVIRSGVAARGSIGVAVAVGLLGAGLGWADYLKKVAEALPKATLAGGGTPTGTTAPAAATGSEAEGNAVDEEKKALEQARKTIAEFAVTYTGIPAKEIPIFTWDGVKGNEMAAITVVEFADFECPHCKMAAFYMKDVAERYRDHVRFVFKNYPLSKKCNDALSRDLHPISCDTAIAVTCAGKDGRFWEVHDLAFDKQGSLDVDDLPELGKEVGIPTDRMAACLADEEVLAQVRQQVAVGRAIGLEGTPAFFVNGREMPSPHPAFVEAAIRKELKDRGITELPADPDGVFSGI